MPSKIPPEYKTIAELYPDRHNYKATGKQLEIDPDAEGIPYDKWFSQQQLYCQQDIDDWVANLRAEREKAEKAKAARR